MQARNIACMCHKRPFEPTVFHGYFSSFNSKQSKKKKNILAEFPVIVINNFVTGPGVAINVADPGIFK